jgi:hypothetical protein
MSPLRHVLPAAVISLLAIAQPCAAERYALIVSGASGGPEYAKQYAKWSADLRAVLQEQMKFDARHVTVLSDADDPPARATAANVGAALDNLRRRLTAEDLLFVVLIGHGTYDGVDAKFNLVGPDLESAQWSELLTGVAGQLVLVNTTAASFPFIERLSGQRRVVISATDSVAQRFETVFPAYFIESLRQHESDIDKNGRVSMWEAFAAATAAVRRHYQQRGQLATERALLDDNADGVGRDVTATGEDGSLASRTYLDQPVAGARPTDEVLLQLLQKRARIEAEAEELKIRRTFMPPDEYQHEFERLMIELSRVGRDIKARVKS